jgi:hypothetical protein
MSEEKEPIPREWIDAFNSAVAAFDNWRRDGGPEPTVSANGRPTSLDLVAGVVAHFAGKMPDAEYQILQSHADRIFHGTGLPEDNSYASGARCLLKMVLHKRQEIIQRKSSEQ